jgi:hypothetical protein
MSCANFIVSSFHLEPSRFYLFMFFLLTQMRSMNSVGGCKTLNSVGGWITFSEILGKHYDRPQKKRRPRWRPPRVRMMQESNGIISQRSYRAPSWV